MAAARKGSAMKMRRSTPIFQTVRQASPSDGAASTGMSMATAVLPASGAAAASRQQGRLAPLGGQHLLAQLDLLVAAPGWLAQAQADEHDDHDRHGEEEEGARQVKTAASPAPRRTPTMAPMLMPERWAE